MSLLIYRFRIIQKYESGLSGLFIASQLDLANNDKEELWEQSLTLLSITVVEPLVEDSVRT